MKHRINVGFHHFGIVKDMVEVDDVGSLVVPVPGVQETLLWII